MLRLFKKTPDNLEEFDLLNSSISIPLSTAQTNPTNPTKYITEYSKSVKLPLTPNNLLLFGYYTELDSIITDLTFKPTAAMEVVVVNDNDIIFEGKLKLDKVNNYKGNRNMECTLYGKMNDFFNKMLNTTWWYDSVLQDETPVNSAGMYVLPNRLDKDYKVNKETVLESWRTWPYGSGAASPFHTATLTPATNTAGYDPVTSQSHSIIAWAPTEQGYYNNFEKDKVIIGGWTQSGDNYIINQCYGGTQGGTLVDIFGTTEELRWITVDEDQKGIADVIVGEGLSERQLCQYRSYYQKPTVYMNHIWQLYKELSEDITGMELVLDEDWFNTSNTRYTDLVYTAQDLQQEKKESSGSSSNVSVSWTAPTIDCHDYAFGTNGGGNATVSLTGTSNINNGHVVVGPDSTGYCNFKVQVGIYLRRRGGLSNSSEYALCNGDGTASCIDLQVAFRNVNDSSDVHTYNFKIVDEDNTSWQASAVDELIRMGTKSWNPDPQTIYFNLEGQVLIGQNNTSSNKEYEMIMSVYCYNGNIDGGSGQALFQTRGRIFNDTALCDSCNDNPTFTFTNYGTTVAVSQEYRSNFRVTMKDLFPANWSPFNALLQYTKLFNLVWDYDQINNKVTVMTREKWFSLHQDEILDWTDKVDTGREFYFKPLAWDKKYITFNYDDFEMDWLKDFKERYGITYGTKRITTQYNFNNDTEELMCTGDTDKINPSIQVSMSRFPLNNITSTTPSPVNYAETFIGNRKENKAANIWGQFYFRNTDKSWDADEGKNNVYVNTNGSSQLSAAWRNFGINLVDDTPFEIRRNIFAPNLCIYASASNSRVQVPNNTRPIFSVYDRNGDWSCQFSKPAMTFYDNDAVEMKRYYSGFWGMTYSVPIELQAQDAYTSRWSSIISEQYNEQNKLLTCYVKLSDADYRKLACNRFVTLGHVLYSLYKIDDYQLGTGGLTKVTLLQVWDKSKYTRQYTPERPPEPEPAYLPEGRNSPFYVENIEGQEETITIGKVTSSLGPNVTVEISNDGLLWSELGITSSMLEFTLQPGQRKYLRATSNYSNVWGSTAFNYCNKILGCSKVGGNILSLMYGSEFDGTQREFPDTASYSFVGLFYNNTTLQDASTLYLTPTTLNNRSYRAMFSGCTNLIVAPIIDATTQKSYSCSSMFDGCTSLVESPVLYSPALVSSCYSLMFSGCTSLNKITCYATSGMGDQTGSWTYNVASSGTFHKAAGSSWPTGTDGIPSGWMTLDGD